MLTFQVRGRATKEVREEDPHESNYNRHLAWLTEEKILKLSFIDRIENNSTLHNVWTKTPG